MQITIKGYGLGDHARLLPPGGGMQVPNETPVADVLRRICLPPHVREGLVLFVNGRPAAANQRLQEGDTLTFFPAAEGG